MICDCERTKLFSKGFAHERSRQCDLYEWQTSLGHADVLPPGFGPIWDRMTSNERDAWEAGVKAIGEL